ncbi:MAG: hypothetical protein F6K47_30905 [Symploca sp. SIO2E6]|nr:hypothetical protein [Symploca sp. SIO2E6]
MGIGNWELGIGNWELGIGNWELGIEGQLTPASCLLPPAFCLLPPASCLLPPASCLQNTNFRVKCSKASKLDHQLTVELFLSLVDESQSFGVSGHQAL